MSIYSRLSDVYAASEAMNIGKNTKLIIMSDVHRGIGNKKDNFAYNKELFCAVLGHYYKQQFIYIELGDGEELWENRSLCRIVEHYSDVYSLFRCFYLAGRFIMIYGNHDIVKRNERITDECYRQYCGNIAQNKYPLFPELDMKEGLRLRWQCGNRDVFLVHGHQVDLINSRLWRLSRFLVRRVWGPLEVLGIQDPTSAAKKPSKSGKIAARMSRWSQNAKTPVICGHNHRFYFPKAGEPAYFNTGCCIYKDYITGIEISGGTIRLVKWSFRADSCGARRAACETLGGPETIEKILSKRIESDN